MPNPMKADFKLGVFEIVRYFVRQMKRLVYRGYGPRVVVQAEDSFVTLRVDRNDFAINPPMLRSVLNGYYVDMKEPCTLYRQNFGRKKINFEEYTKVLHSDQFRLTDDVHYNSDDDVIEVYEAEVLDSDDEVVHTGH